MAIAGGAPARVHHDGHCAACLDGHHQAGLATHANRYVLKARETVVAEKIDAMVQLGMANSRMKDFYDIAVLARDFEFDGETLARAIRATFERRATALPMALPVALTDTFAEDSTKKTQWSGFVRKAGVDDATSLAEVVANVAAFVKLKFPRF